MNPTHSSPEEIFRRLLDESSSILGAPQEAGIAIPDDDLHRDILIPLLPAMLGDGAIRKHWHDQAATGFLARLMRHLEGGEAAPRWQPGDFEIHVTASYSAGPDARALADTLLSEDSLRDLSAGLMNQILDIVWPGLSPAAEREAAAAPMVDASPIATPRGVEIPAVSPVRRPTRIARPNPIRGTQTSHGGFGAPDWTAGYPLAGWRGGAACRRGSRERSGPSRRR
jgi:hypothetical protein